MALSDVRTVERNEAGIAAAMPASLRSTVRTSLRAMFVPIPSFFSQRLGHLPHGCPLTIHESGGRTYGDVSIGGNMRRGTLIGWGIFALFLLPAWGVKSAAMQS